MRALPVWTCQPTPCSLSLRPRPTRRRFAFGNGPSLLLCLPSAPMLANTAFFPRRETKGGASDGEYSVPASEYGKEAKIGFRAFPLPSRSVSAPVVLHFHGNGEIASDMDRMAPMFHALGWAVIAVDFRGNPPTHTRRLPTHHRPQSYSTQSYSTHLGDRVWLVL